MKVTDLTSRLSRTRMIIIRSFWSFPIALLSATIILAAFGISGSSVGTYDGYVNDQKPPVGKLVSKPKAIRSDEWLVNTQMTVAQYNDGFPVFNKDIGDGQDMSVVLDVPYKEWSVVFKPQNWIFFVAPLNFAFAFKWWSLAAVLAFGVYALYLKLIPKQKLAAILLSACVFFAPMVQWWYQSITILPLAIGFCILTLLLMAHEPMSRRKRFVVLGTLSYSIATFALVMYPPFQIPIALSVSFFYIAYCMYTWRYAKNGKQLAQSIAAVAASSVIAVAFVGGYLLQHSSAVSTISSTVYPGHRDIAAGDYSLRHVTGTYLSPFQMSAFSVAHYTELKGGTNQSEISGFIYPVVPLVLFGIYLLFRKKQTPDILSLSLIAGSTVMLIVFLLRFGVPYGNGAYRLLGLNLVPHNRLMIGVGFACTMLIIGAARAMWKQPVQLPKLTIAGLAGLLTVAYIALTNSIVHHNPGYVTRTWLAGCAVAATIAFILFFVTNKVRLAFLALLGLSIVSSALVNPLERNLDEITGTDMSRSIQSTVRAQPSAGWVSNMNVTFENYAAANGARAINATATYPQLATWRSIDPDRKYQDIYNRYAHIMFNFDDTQATPTFSLISPDTFQVKLSACDPFLAKENIRYIYSTSKLQSACLKPVRTFNNPTVIVYLYERT